MVKLLVVSGTPGQAPRSVRPAGRWAAAFPVLWPLLYCAVICTFIRPSLQPGMAVCLWPHFSDVSKESSFFSSSSVFLSWSGVTCHFVAAAVQLFSHV